MHFLEVISYRILKLYPKACQNSQVHIDAAYQAMTWAKVDEALCCRMTSPGANTLMR